MKGLCLLFIDHQESSREQVSDSGMEITREINIVREETTGQGEAFSAGCWGLIREVKSLTEIIFFPCGSLSPTPDKKQPNYINSDDTYATDSS